MFHLSQFLGSYVLYVIYSIGQEHSFNRIIRCFILKEQSKIPIKVEKLQNLLTRDCMYCIVYISIVSWIGISLAPATGFIFGFLILSKYSNMHEFLHIAVYQNIQLYSRHSRQIRNQIQHCFLPAYQRLMRVRFMKLEN